MYKLIVTKFEKNERYEEELQEMNRHSYRWLNQNSEPIQPQRELPCEMLAVMLTDEQWMSVQKSVLATFR